MNILEFRELYPQYNDMSDKQLSDAIYKTHYSDIDRKDFNERFFGGTGSAGKDIMQSVKAGAWGLAALPSNIYGLATGDYEQLGGPTVRQYAAEAAEKRSPLYKLREREAQAAIEEAQQRGELAGAGEAIKQYISDPRLLSGAVAEAAPSMVGSLGTGKLAQAGIGALARRGIAAGAEREAALAAANEMAAKQGFNVATGTMASMQGGDVAQQTYQAVYRAAIDKGMSNEEAQAIAASEARKAGLIGAGVSALTMKGLPGFEKAAFTGIGSKTALGGAAKGFLGEAAQESLEEGGGQMAQNLALQAVNPEQALMQGVGSTMARAGIIGGIMGGPSGAISGSLEGSRARQEEAARLAAAQKEEADRQKELSRIEAERIAREAQIDKTRRDVFAKSQAAINARAQAETITPELRQTLSTDLDRGLELMNTPEGITQIKSNMGAFFPQVKGAELKSLSAQLETLRKRMIAQQKADENYAKTSAFTAATPDLLGEIAPQTTSVPEVPAPQAAPELQLGAPATQQPLISEQGQLALPVTETLTMPKLKEYGIIPTTTNLLYKAVKGLDLRDPVDLAYATNVVAEIAKPENKASKTNQLAAAKLLAEHPAFQAPVVAEAGAQITPEEQAELPGLKTAQEFQAWKKRSDAAKKGVETRKANALLAAQQATEAQPTPEVPNAAQTERPDLGQGVTEDLFAIPQKEFPAQVPEITEAVPAAAVPSADIYSGDQTEAGPAPAVGGVEPTVQPTGPGSSELRGITTGERVPGAAGEIAGEGVQNAGVVGQPLTPNEFIASVYENTPRNPFNPNQHAFVWGEGEQQHGAFFELEPSKSAKNAVEVHWINAFPLRQGAGTKALLELQRQAQAAGLSLTLYPQPNGPVSQAALKKFYRGLGFMPLHGKAGATMIWKPTETTTQAPIQTTEEQRAIAQQHADDVAGQVVWQQGDLALVRGYSPLGNPTYAVTKGGKRSRVDVDAYTGDLVTPEEKAQLSEAKKQIEAEDKTREQFDPFAGKDLAVSQSVPAGVANVLSGWKKLLGIQSRIYVTTLEDARANQGDFTGDYRAIGSAAIKNEGGVMRRLPNGDYYIAFETTPSRAAALETLAHEMGHVHEREVYNNAPAETKAALKAEFDKWLAANKTGTAKALVENLRARKTGKETVAPEGMAAADLTNYWKSFGEWYADQVSRWATTSEKPLSVVEKFFQKLGRAMKAFYQKVVNAKYLPNETFKQYLDKVADTVSFEDLAGTEATPETRSAAVNRARAALRKQGFSSDEIDEQLAAMTPEEIEADFPAARTEPLTKEQMRAIEKQARIDGDVAQMRKKVEPLNVDLERLLVEAGGKPAIPNLTMSQKAQQTVDKLATHLKNDTTTSLYDQFRTNKFSSDQAFQSRIRKALQSMGIDWKDTMMKISTSQALHRGGIAERFMENGKVVYDDVMNRWDTEVDDQANMVLLGNTIADLAKQHGTSTERMQVMVGRAWIAERLNGLNKEINRLEALPKLTPAQKDTLERLQNVVDKAGTPEEIAAGLQLGEDLGELYTKATDIKNTMRQRTIDLLVDTGVMDAATAEEYMDHAEWVPFYRESDEDQKAGGPTSQGKGLVEQMRQKKIKGSTKEIADPVSNLVKWMDWSVRRAVSNKQKQVMLDVFQEHLPDEVREGKGETGHNMTVMQDGVEKTYNFDDPFIAMAFRGLEPIMVPGLKDFAKVMNILRQSIVLFPGFSAVQLVTDTYDAMFSSGLKHPFALVKEVAKEVARTYKGTSTARPTLQRAGILSGDYSAMAEQEATQVLAGLKTRTKFQAAKHKLEKFANAADNVVRQAVYNRVLAEGGSKVEAQEKATELINFRRGGAGTGVNALRQVVPFFGAYLQVQNVALKTLSGESISPTERKEALKTLLWTAGKVMALSALYAMVMGEDDDYKKMDRRSRDKMIMIPGMGGIGLPIRPNVYSAPKILTEHLYGLVTDNGTTDGKKFRAAAQAALLDSVMPSSYAMPQVVRPLVEVATDHSFYNDRPLLGNLSKLEKSEQYTAGTSELGKLVGKTGIMSPIVFDHLFKGYLGSLATLTQLATNDAIAAATGVPRPEKTWREAITSIPNMSNFVAKEFGTGDKTDFYELAKDVTRVNDTVNRLKSTGRAAEIPEYLDEENLKLYAQKKQVARIQDNLSKLRKQRNIILESRTMSSEEKAAAIRSLNESEQRMVQNVKAMRERAYD